MTIRVVDSVSELRFYEDSDPAPMARNDCVCVLHRWWGPIGMLTLMNGDMSRKLLRELADELINRGIRVVFADRAPGRQLPLFRLVDDGDFKGLHRLVLAEVPLS
ncbi:MAG: hypothetical protein KIT73_04210 [Burkholderiales bacterium]|nr:hypothetical protein [Burkholderiales bacterium]